MKRKKRGVLTCSVLAAIMLLSACSKTEQTDATTVDSTKLYETTFDFSLMMSYTAATQESNPYMETYVQDLLNCKINYIKIPNASYAEKLNTTLASASLPDMVYMSAANAEKWIEQEALVALDDYLETEGQDIKKVYTPEDMANITNLSDGKIYFIRGINTLSEINSLGIRQDWLDTLALEKPNTIDEWHAVLSAFKANAQKLDQPNLIPWAGSLAPFYNAYGIMASGSSVGYGELYTLDENNNYMLKYEHPRFREALETIRTFYADGLIDPEYISRKDTTSIYELFNNGTAGAGLVYASRLREITDILREIKPDALLSNIEPIQGPDGTRKIVGRDKYTTAGCITVSAEKKGITDKLVRFLNYFFFSQEGIMLNNYGVEGMHYDILDGKPVLREPYNQGWIELRNQGMNNTAYPFVWDRDAYNQSLLNGKELDTLDAVGRLVYDGLYTNSEYCYTPLKTFSTPILTRRGTDLLGSLAEIESQTIMGYMSVDEFFAEYAKIKADGLDELSAELSQQWEKFQNQININK